VVALLAHTTSSKIGSILLDCSIVSRLDTRGKNVLPRVCDGLPSIKTVPGQHVLRHEGDGFPICFNVTLQSHR
jgi:hypothetical protein